MSDYGRRITATPFVVATVSAFIAIFEAEVIDFRTTEATVRSFVEIALGETVFVADVPEATPAVTPEEPPNELSVYRRRVIFSYDKWMEGGDFLGGDERLGGVIHADGRERRYSDFEYRVLVKHRIVLVVYRFLARSVLECRGLAGDCASRRHHLLEQRTRTSRLTARFAYRPSNGSISFRASSEGGAEDVKIERAIGEYLVMVVRFDIDVNFGAAVKRACAGGYRGSQLRKDPLRSR